MPSDSPTGRAEQFGKHAAALLGLSIPISVALDNVLLAVIALSWLVSGNTKKKFEVIAANPVALAALALFGMLVAGLFYGTRYPGQGVAYLLKYVDLLFIPIFITLFQEARTRELAVRWFCVAMVVCFVVAELASLGLLLDNPWLSRTPGNAFKRSITHGLLSAVAAFVFALLAHRQRNWPQRLLFGALALVAVKNVLVLGISRTAYLVLVLLALYYFFALSRRRGLLIAGLVLAASFSGFYGASETFRERVDTVWVDEGDWSAKWPSRESVTVRLEWYRQGLDVMLSHPIAGVGTGSFPRVLAENAQASGAKIYAPNPHNEYLALGMQTGLAGIALLLHLWWQQLRLSVRLATPVETHLARGLVITMAVGCLFNSLLLDHTEGLLYAWFTGLLYGGLRSPPSPGGARASEPDPQA